MRVVAVVHMVVVLAVVAVLVVGDVGVYIRLIVTQIDRNRTVVVVGVVIPIVR